MSRDASSELAVHILSPSPFDRVALGLEAYVTRLMRGALWAVLFFVPVEVGLALSGGGGIAAVLLGAALAAAAIAGIATSDRLLPWMREHPWSLILIAVGVAGLMWWVEAGPPAGYFGSLVYFPIALAALGGLPAHAVAAAVVLTGAEVGLTGSYGDESLSDLVVDPRWLLNAGLPLMLSLGLSIPVWFLVRFLGALPQTLGEIETEVADPPPPPALPAGADPWSVLSAAEQRVVERLPDQAPKQIAAGLELSLATVRTHIQRAKRATGSRTQAELAAWAARHRPTGEAAR